MTTGQITDTEVEEALRDVRARYARVRYHLRQAANELLQISNEYGLNYEPLGYGRLLEANTVGGFPDDAYGMVWAAHGQVSFDRSMLLELVQAMGE